VALLRRITESLLRGLDVPEESIDDVAVALSEACGNVIRHAPDTAEYGVRFTVVESACEIEVHDIGPGFAGAVLDPPAFAQPDDAPSEDGRGLPLVRALMDDLQFVREHETTTVRLIKRWDALGLG
jgi:serine/threonine-protein kinase RsbW